MPANAYVEFDRVVRSTERWLAEQHVPALETGGAAVRERLIQRIVELALPPFMRSWRARADGGGAPDMLALGTVKVHPQTGRTSIAPAYFGRLVLEFGAHWCLALAAIVKGFGNRSTPSRAPATLLFGVGNEGLFHRGSDARFITFCREGPVLPLREATQIVAQTTVRSGTVSDACVSYATRPLLDLAQRAHLTTLQRLSLLVRHVLAALKFGAAIAQRPLLALLAPDLAVGHIARVLYERGDIEAIVITNTLYTSQPLWMRRFAADTGALHMVWYSQNTVPLVYARDRVRADLPHNRHIRVSQHWVWTDGYRAYLGRLGVGGSAHVVGPLLWYLPPGEALAEDGIQIAVFDVTPVSDAYAEKLGLIDNYYSAPNMLEFMRGVIALKAELDAAFQRPVRVLLKHKRGYGAVHDKTYIDFIAQQTCAGGPLTLVPPDHNMYSMIGASALTIVVPYSSPAHVSAQMGVPAIYFDAPGVLEESHDGGPLLDFASGTDALINKAKAALANNDAMAR